MDNLNITKECRIIVDKCFGLKENEKFLAVYDEPMKDIAEEISNAAKKVSSNVELIETPIAKVNGEEPPSVVAEKMKGFDVIVLVSSKSLSHTNARREAQALGARIASLPLITKEIIKRTIDVDYEFSKDVTNRIASAIEGCKQIEIITEKGTNLVLNIEGYKPKRSLGQFLYPKMFGNLPGSEMCMGVEFLDTNGTLVIDASIPKEKVDEPIFVEIVDGRAVSINGGSSAKKLDSMLALKGEKAYYVGEFAFGTNPKAIITGNTLEDEKVFGTIHIAFGNNVSFDGTNSVGIHLDCVVTEPTVKVDGKVIMEKGNLLI